jgi:1-aminocyclopropane-1-carboxylate deaminase/D-cysteine desulfhydrase-like pyridoxal-dependent ACC family enzyme
MDGKRIVFLHTGGVQGAQSIIEKSGFDLFGG